MTPTTADSSPKWMRWTGIGFSVLPSLLLLMSAVMKLSRPPAVIENFVTKYGFRPEMLTGLGVLELSCVALYLVPQTAVLGAILLTGYLGGAVVTHLRAGEAFVIPVVVGVFVWAGIFLRDERIRALLPLRRRA